MESLSHVPAVPEENRRRCDWRTMLRRDPGGDRFVSRSPISAERRGRWRRRDVSNRELRGLLACGGAMFVSWCHVCSCSGWRQLASPSPPPHPHHCPSPRLISCRLDCYIRAVSRLWWSSATPPPPSTTNTHTLMVDRGQ